MKNLIVALLVVFTLTSVSSANCLNGTCSRTPVRNFGVAVAHSTKRIVTAPSRFVKKVQTNRTYRRTN
jgi:hypothetical protein